MTLSPTVLGTRLPGPLWIHLAADHPRALVCSTHPGKTPLDAGPARTLTMPNEKTPWIRRGFALTMVGLGLALASPRALATPCQHNRDCWTAFANFDYDCDKKTNTCCGLSNGTGCTSDSQCCSNTTDTCTSTPGSFGPTCCAKLLSDGGGNRCVDDQDCCGWYNGYGYSTWKTTGWDNSFYDCNPKTDQCQACYPDGHLTTTHGPDDGGLTRFPPDGSILAPVCCSGAANEWPPKTDVTCCHPLGSACYDGPSGTNAPYCCNSIRDAVFVASQGTANPLTTCASGVCCSNEGWGCTQNSDCCSGVCDPTYHFCQECSR